MRLLLPTFRLRTLLLLVATAAFLSAIGERSRRIHHAAKFIESHGGDVWVGGTLYSGDGLGVVPRTKSQVLFDRTKIHCRLLCGKEGSLWVCFMPEDRDALTDAITLLNARAVRFDVLGETDRSWLLSRFSDLEVRGRGRTAPDAGNRRADPTFAVPQSAQAVKEPADRRENFIRSLEIIEQFFAENPEIAYRLQRYESLIGYPAHGEMGRRLDHETGRIIYLPWPKD